MTDANAPVTVAASILYLRWDGGPEAVPPMEDALYRRLQAALHDWHPSRRLVLQAPQGLVIAGQVEPSVARNSATALTRMKGVPPLRVGVHFGELRITADPAVQVRVAGEGLQGAVAAAEAAGPDRVGVSDAFSAALAAQSRGARRNALAGFGVFALLAAGLGGRQARERYELAHRPATIQLDIRPWGDVFVDGEAKGRTPPLVRLSLPPGPHTIEVRNGRFKPLHMEVQLQPAETLDLKHVFAAPRAPAAPRKEQPGPLERFKFW